jgi:hypothetical protein
VPWRSHSLPIGKACATLRHASLHSRRSFIIWAFAVRCGCRRWETPTLGL